ncbi:WbqC family protein [Flavobacterium aciduliphilum]|uniref:WbqC-like protein n=1 Tax=Flavobacterium aciduliphilum TaxID=1101402 RepID=A0A328YQC8_9FLAO|nr:WbqC family protein [Flavobacterium aciduliphilum]RAR75564.1 WbqC-like protein [Flavobacterium aciduliphilum]
MNPVLLYPTYFGSISHFVAMAQADRIVLEVEDHFQKQTNRNRMYIYSPNGIQLLNVPVKHSAKNHQKTKEVRIENDFGWQKQHFKSLDAAYRSSPFFEYFEDDIRVIFEKHYTYLMDLNLDTLDLVSRCLRMPLDYTKTIEYFHEPEGVIDLRPLANGKKDTTLVTPYTQVFEQKHGFLNNLSILDVLFNEGKFALDYLKSQVL